MIGVEDAPTAAAVLARTARSMRGDLKTEVVARAARAAGLTSWNTGRVAHLESGRVSPTVTMLYALASAFSEILDKPVRIADLFAGEGPVAVADGEVIELAKLRAALSGQPVDSPSKADFEDEMAQFTREVNSWPGRLQALPAGKFRRVGTSLMEADMRLIRSLGISRVRGIAEMACLWEKSFVAKRDELAGPDANQQKRGRISRELKQELDAVLHGDD